MDHRPAFAAFLSLLLLTPSAFALPDPFELSADPTHHDAHVGQRVQSNITVHANENVTVDLNVTFASPGLQATLSRSSLTVAAGNASSSTLTITVQNGTLPGQRHVEVRGVQRNGTHVELTNVTVTIHEQTDPVDAQLDITPDEVEVEAGDVAQLTLTCEANAPVELDLTHNAPPPGWNVTLSSATCIADPSSSGTVAIDVRTANTSAGQWTLHVNGQDGAVNASANATIRIAAPPQPPPPLFETRTCILATCVHASLTG